MQKPNLQKTKLAHRFGAFLCGLGQSGKPFSHDPEPQSIGRFEVGQAIVAGQWVFCGQALETNENALWAQDLLTPLAVRSAHGFEWLEDLAALGDGPSQTLANTWLMAWIDRFGTGKGPGWAPEIVGRRLIRWVHNGVLLTSGQRDAEKTQFYKSLRRQTRFVTRYWTTAPDGLPKIEALTGAFIASAHLGVSSNRLAALRASVDQAFLNGTTTTGELASRNPEQLGLVLVHMAWVGEALKVAGLEPSAGFNERLENVAKTLRGLRHVNGRLPRFHGAVKNVEPWVEQALSQFNIRGLRPDDRVMGFAKLSGGRTSVIVDAETPPAGPDGQASTLAFEMVPAGQPIIVNAGNGAVFGASWARKARETFAQSTLCLDSLSSSGFSEKNGQRELTKGAAPVTITTTKAIDGARINMSHGGYVDDVGFVHERIMDITLDGKGLVGYDRLLRKRMDGADASVPQRPNRPIKYAVRFHLAPGIIPALEARHQAIVLRAPDNQSWMFRHDGQSEVGLAPSICFSPDFDHPQQTQQIVLTGMIKENTAMLRWSLVKVPVGPLSSAT